MRVVNGHKVGAVAPARRPSPDSLSPFLSNQINREVGLALGKSSLSDSDFPLSYGESYLRRVFWSKYSSPGAQLETGKEDVSPTDRMSRAVAKWQETEVRNSNTNNRLLFGSCDFKFGTSGQLLLLARKYIRETLGAKPPRTIRGSFTGGASTRVKREAGSIALKFEGKAHASRSARPYWVSNVFENTGWFTLNPKAWETEETESSVLFTVPKNSEIDRVACKEPEINMYLQRGLGDFIRGRLRRSGIDLNDQTRNQDLARLGSKTRSHATMDLSSASDTVSTTLVRLLLPHAWFETLDDLRVKSVRMPDGSLHQLEMFSSMGNGFTFELETLIFWSLARAVATSIRRRGRILVYGDDIVAPKDVVLALGRVLHWFGFKVNVKKTFVRGPFRESCGGHYLNGMDVTPVYFRKRIQSMSEVIQLGNQLTRWVLRTHFGVFCNSKVLNLISFIRDFVPQRLHGGQQLERTDALVTGVPPRERLVQVHKPKETAQLGSYLWWLHEKERSLDTFSPSESADLGRWVLRPNRSWYERELMSEVRHELSIWLEQARVDTLVTGDRKSVV